MTWANDSTPVTTLPFTIPTLGSQSLIIKVTNNLHTTINFLLVVPADTSNYHFTGTYTNYDSYGTSMGSGPLPTTTPLVIQAQGITSPMPYTILNITATDLTGNYQFTATGLNFIFAKSPKPKPNNQNNPLFF